VQVQQEDSAFLFGAVWHYLERFARTEGGERGGLGGGVKSAKHYSDDSSRSGIVVVRRNTPIVFCWVRVMLVVKRGVHL
jgi:hypothetical protein